MTINRLLALLIIITMAITPNEIYNTTHLEKRELLHWGGGENLINWPD